MWRKFIFGCLLFALLATPLITLAAHSPTAVSTQTTQIHQQQEENGRDISRQDWVDRVPLMIIVIIIVILINVVLLRIVMPKEDAIQES